MSSTSLQCYNKGCGKTFDANNNPDDACCHHPGLPFFHDAYKGWSCCNRKCIDFTEFLNMKGCTKSKHSNIKPPEPEKSPSKLDNDKEIIEVKPMVHPKLKRPPIETPLTTMKPEIASSLKTFDSSAIIEKQSVLQGGDDIAVGTLCKNSGCNTAYQGSQTNDQACIYHSGSPIFHEGLKYWSCCLKKTCDFTAFLNQTGCQSGKHVWQKDDLNDKLVECRWDWHQTASYVVVSIYAKKYCPTSSIVQLSPVRVFANLVFPLQSHATFTLDVELHGVIDVKASQVSMYGTKVEVKLKKAEPGSWSKLDISKAPVETISMKVENLTPIIDAVDLSDL